MRSATSLLGTSRSARTSSSCSTPSSVSAARQLGIVEPVVDGARTTYRAANDGQDPTLVIERRACNDTMSGELFEAAVTVTFESVTLHGCGRWL